MNSACWSFRFSSWLVRTWFALVGLACLVVALLAVVPNEIRDHVGVWPYGLWLVLLVAILGLPLLIIATLLDRSRPKG
jgi:hypothetical protein